MTMENAALIVCGIIAKNPLWTLAGQQNVGINIFLKMDGKLMFRSKFE